MFWRGGMGGLRREIRKVLAIRMSALGDLIHCEGALHDLRCFYARDRGVDTQITLLVKRAYLDYASRCPWVDSVIVDDAVGFWGTFLTLPALARRLKGLEFFRVFDFHNTWRTKLYKTVFFGRSLSTPAFADESVQCRYARVLMLGGITQPAHVFRPDVSWLAEDMRSFLFSRGIDLVKAPLVVLCHSCSKRGMAKKAWPGYRELARILVDRGVVVATVPGPNDEHLDIQGVHNLRQCDGSALTLPQMAGVLKAARYVVGNDTGPAHMAACLGKNGLMLFGAYRIKARHTGIRRASRFSVIEKTDLGQITTEEVAKAVLLGVGDR